MKKIMIGLALMYGTTAISQSVQEGNSYLYYERFNSAEKTFSQLTKADGNNAEAWFGLTKTYLLTDKDSAAQAALAGAPVGVQEQPWFEVAKGWALLSSGNSNAAAPLLQKALEQTKEKDPAILAAVAQAHIDAKAGNAQYAVDLLTKAIKRDKHNAALYVMLGDAYRKMLNGSEAYQAYKNAIEENDKYAAAYHSIGQIFQTQKNAEMYLDYFNKAVAADAAYAPSLYSLYLYQYYHDASKAAEYYKQYVAHSDPSIQNEYDVTDLAFLTKDYGAAVEKAKAIVQKEGNAVKPRLYKLIGYSYAALKDTSTALSYMQQYFAKAPDSVFVSKDYLIISDLYAASQQDSLAMLTLSQAAALEPDSTVAYTYYKKLSDQAASQKDFAAQAEWAGKYYEGNAKATNLDLFNWGVANYRAGNYSMADSVFGRYIARYPEQSFGYYWQARSKALLDEGLAVPAYEALIDVLQKDTANANYKQWLVQAYSYLAAYETNKEKNYAEAVDYFEKVLEVDPQNEDAKKYIAILEKQVSK